MIRESVLTVCLASLSALSSFAVTITQQPQDQLICSGQIITLNVSASGTGFIMYQWSSSLTGAALSWSEITGATNSYLTVSYSSMISSNMYYMCKVTELGNGYVFTRGAKVTKGSYPSDPVSLTATPSTVCPGDPVTLTVSGSPGTGSEWVYYIGGCGSIELAGVSGSSPTVHPTTWSTYYVRAENGCGESNCAQASITLKTASSAATGINATDTSVCAGKPTALSVEGGSLGTNAGWVWYAGDCGGTVAGTGAEVTVSPETPTIYYVRAEGECDTTECVSISIGILDTPDSPFATDPDVCEGEDVSITASGTSVKWYSNRELTDLLTTGNDYDPAVTLPGTYTYYVTQTGTECESLPDTAILTVRPVPDIPAADNKYGCVGRDIPDLAAEGADIKWFTDPQLLNQVHSGNTFTTGKDQAGTYTWYLTQTVDACTSPPDTVKLMINNIPGLPSADDHNICYGITGTSLTATGTDLRWYSDAGLTTLVFSGSVFSPEETISGAHKWYVTQTVNHCESGADTVTLFIYPETPKPLVTDDAVCFGETTPALNATGSDVKWYSDNELSNLVDTGTEFTPAVTDAGEYHWYVSQTENGCESDAETITLNIYAIPPKPVAEDITGCFGDVVPALNTTGENVRWYTDNSLTNLVHTGNSYNSGKTEVGTYRWYVTQTINGCTGLADTFILVIRSKPSAPDVEDESICYGQTNPMVQATGSNIRWYQDGGLTSLEHSGSIFQPIQTATGSYLWYVTQTVDGCQSKSDTFRFTVKALPLTPEVEDTAVCSDETIPQFTATGFDVTWYSDESLTITACTENAFTPDVSNRGIYTWYVTDTYEGCESDPGAISLEIIDYPDPPVCSDLSICQGAAVPVLTATGSSVKWFSNASLTVLADTGNSYSSGKTEPGTYRWYVTQADRKCVSDAAVAVLKIRHSPVASVIQDNTVCQGSSLSLGSGLIDGYSYSWKYKDSTGVFSTQGDPVITPDATLTYILTVTLDSTECTDENQVTVTVNPAPQIALFFEKNPLPLGENTEITATGGTTYQWSPATGLSAITGVTVTAHPENDIVYTVASTNNFGCTGSAKDTLFVSCQMCKDTLFLASRGLFNHGCTDRGYNNNASCTWTIFPSGVENIYLYFHPDSFDIRSGDFLNIYDGTDATGTLIGAYNNDNPPEGNIMAGSAVFIQLVTDGSGTGSGFQARYSNQPLGITYPAAAFNNRIYPNPVKEILYIEWPATVQHPCRIQICNSLGQLCFSILSEGSAREEINLEGLASGIYYLNLITDTGSVRKIFIKSE